MRWLFVLAFAGCGFSTTVTPSDGTTDTMVDARPIDGAPGSARKRRITIPDAKVFESLTDFPMLVVIDDMTGLGAKATTGGDDIFFTRLDGTPLEHERIVWNKATGHLEEWVKVSLTDGGVTELDLRFGDPGPAHAPNPLQTWSNNFSAVWHMEDALGGNTMVADARGVVNGTAVNGPQSIAGKVGKGIDFDGTNDEVTFTSPIGGNTSSTVSAWVAVAQPANGFSSVMTVGNPAAGQSRFMHTNYMGLAIGFFGTDIQTNVNIHDNQFTLLHWVYDGGTKESSLYRDGMQVGTTATIAATVNTAMTNGHIGSAPQQWGPGGNTTNPVNGIIDEVRIASMPRSLGWIRTEYENQRDPKAFFMLGSDMPVQ